MKIGVALIIISIAILTSCSSGSSNISHIQPDLNSTTLKREIPLMESDSQTAGQLQTINFNYDSWALTKIAKSKLKKNAKYLQLNNEINIIIEGHCDQRGDENYNLLLGLNRAKSVKDYLTSIGVSSSRISIISYGKKKPIDKKISLESWAKNRRANFVIQ